MWEVANAYKKKAALKLLLTPKLRQYARFRDEVEVVRANSDVPGLLPILDRNLPADLQGSTPWYVMPLAEPLQRHLANSDAMTVVGNFISLSATLAELHRRKISHRDIKPGNLLRLEDRPYIGDFGLVDYPDKEDVTLKGESIGPKWTMAPEMRRNAEKADGIPADVYSLAKTMWILLTKQNKGFDGQYSNDSTMGLKEFQPSIYVAPLDRLLLECTDNDPGKRPRMDQFQDRLKEWLIADRDFHVRNSSQWKDIQNDIFPLVTPARAIWENLDSIVAILKILSHVGQLNHMFMPTGGGNDLLDARRSHEDGCIELDFGYVLICKPKRLVFESFDHDEEWNYFRLECEELQPTPYYSTNGAKEYLTELEPLLYTDANCAEFNDFNGEELAVGARAITRILSKGSFVIFRKTSTYNNVTSTYDARHNKMTAEEFRSYIGNTIKELSRGVNQTKKEVKPIRIVRPDRYRAKRRLLTESEKQLLDKVISLAEESEAEDVELQRKHNVEHGLKLSDKSSYDYFSEARPKADAFENFLADLPGGQVLLVAAVMYAGRDAFPPLWGPPLDLLMESLAGEADLASTIAEKASVGEYLKAGMELYTHTLRPD